MSGSITLVLGGARSGKSEFAERLAAESGKPVTYIATADSKDSEMTERIARHKAKRPLNWRMWEGSPESLPIAVGKMSGILLLDCLTMWLTRLFLADRASEDGDEKAWSARESEIRKLTEKLCGSPPDGSCLIIVSNEVGFGLVPPYLMGRRFRDLQGRMNQLCASRAEKVVLVVAGYPLWIKV